MPLPLSRRTEWLIVALAVVAAPLTAAPLTAEAQPRQRSGPTVGVLAIEAPEDVSPARALRDGLRDGGFMHGRNIEFEWRWAAGQRERFRDFAADLVRLNAAVIVASNDAATLAAQRATKTIPIVMVYASDPVGLKFVASLSRPGGNITGLTAPDLAGKRLQLLKEAIPTLSRVAVLWDPSEPGGRRQVSGLETAARGLGMQLQLQEVRTATALDGAFAAITRRRADAVVVGASMVNFVNRARIGELAIRHRLPTMCPAALSAQAGCLMSYDASLFDLYRRAASFAEKILKGARPSELPVERPTTFELVLNGATATALGLTLPDSLTSQAALVLQ